MSWKESFRNAATVNLLLAVVAVAAGGGTYLLSGRFLAGRAAQLEQQSRQVLRPRPVVVAKHDISAGQLLDSGQLAIREMPAGFLPGGALDQDNAHELVGRRLSVDLQKGDPVVPTMLRSAGVESLSAVLPAGLRALTVPIDEANALSGLLSPGDWVDIFLARGQGASGRFSSCCCSSVSRCWPRAPSRRLMGKQRPRLQWRASALSRFSCRRIRQAGWCWRSAPGR